MGLTSAITSLRRTFVQPDFGFPAQFCMRAGRAGIARCDVPFAARGIGKRDFLTAGFCISDDHFHNGHSLPDPEVKRTGPLVGLCPVESRNMCLGQIKCVDIVANARSIWRVVVRAKHADMVASPDGDLSIRLFGIPYAHLVYSISG